MILLPFERALRSWMGDRGMAWEEERYPRAEAGGATRAVRLRPAGKPRALALVAHGAGNDALYGFVGLFKMLLARGVEIFTFDMDGHGRSCDTRLSAFGARGAVAEALSRGAAERGLPVHAVGVSLGGAILLAALPDLQPRLASAALLVAPIHVELTAASLRSELRTGILRTLWREREHYGWLGLIPSFGPFKRDAYPLRLDVPVPRGAFGYVRVLNDLLGDLDPAAAAARVTLPVLLVYGALDRIVPAAQGERLARFLRRGELLRVPGGTHLTTPMEPAVTARLLEWIAGDEATG